MAKMKLPRGVSPAGTGAYMWAYKPDEGHQYSDGKYKVTLVLDKADCPDDEFDIEFRSGGEGVTLRALAEAAAEEKWGKVPADLALPFVKDGDEHKNEEFDGKWIITAKSKFEPTIVDAKRQELPDGIEARSGDLIKINVTFFPYESTEKVKEKVNGKVKTTVVETKGVTMQLTGIQLLEKRNMGGGAGDFEDESDYEGMEGKRAPAQETGGDDPDDF